MSNNLATIKDLNPMDNTLGYSGQYLTFRCRGERFALPIGLIREIIEFGAITQIPAVPTFIRGVINLRGRVVPVIDLACRFGQGRTETGKRTCIVIMELEEGGTPFVLGLVVDAVDSVLDIDEADIEPAPRFGAGIQADFIGGMVKAEGGFIVLLRVSSVLSVQDMKSLVLASEGAPCPTSAAADEQVSR